MRLYRISVDDVERTLTNPPVESSMNAATFGLPARQAMGVLSLSWLPGTSPAL